MSSTRKKTGTQGRARKKTSAAAQPAPRLDIKRPSLTDGPTPEPLPAPPPPPPGPTWPPRVGDLWWTKFNDGGLNQAWHPWIEIELVEPIYVHPTDRLAVVVGVTTKKVGKSPIRLVRGGGSIAPAPPEGARRWGHKDKKQVEKRAAESATVAGPLFCGCDLGEETADAD